MRFATLLALATGAAAQYRGFNYGSLDASGAPRSLQEFTDQFKAAKGLAGTNGEFTAARLFTMIQAGTTADPTTAIQAAIDTDTSLLLGLWGSGGQEGFNAELGALKSAIDQHGSDFTSRVVGISVGSEDLYRISPTGIENQSGAGAGPDTLVSYIDQLRQLVSGTGLAKAPVGHVDTWTAWVNGSNSAVIDAVDFLGLDAYPYFQNTDANAISNGESLFFSAYDATTGVSKGKSVWVTETGWPVTGDTSGQAVASTANAETYWQAVSCRLQSMNVNLWWFTLDEASTNGVSFNVANPSNIFGQPQYDLSCSGSVATASSSAAPSSTAAASSSAAPYSAPASSSASSSAAASATTAAVSSSSASASSSKSACSSKTSSATTAAATTASSSSMMTVVFTTVASGSTPGSTPELVTRTSVVNAPVATTSAAKSPAATTAQSATPLPYAGSAARAAGGAAAGLAGLVAFFL